MRWIFLVVAMICAIGTVSRIIDDWHHDDLHIVITVSIVCFIIFLILNRHAVKINDLYRWMAKNKNLILTKGSFYNGNMYIHKTRIKRYLKVYSFVVYSVKIPSKIYHQKDPLAIQARIGCTLASLFFGWWGIPWGPIWTIQAIFVNLTGGYETTLERAIYQDKEV